MKGFLKAIDSGNEKELRNYIDKGCNPKASFIWQCCEVKPLGYACLRGANEKCCRILIDAGANPYRCGLIEQLVPKYLYVFFNSRNSARSYAILAMHATHKTYGKDVARIIARVIWELRGNCAAPLRGAAKKIKK